MAMWMAAVVGAGRRSVLGDLHGAQHLRAPAAKVAAMEGHFETERGAPLILFGMPDMARERDPADAIEIPELAQPLS